MMNQEFLSTILNNETQTLNSILTIKELEDWLD